MDLDFTGLCEVSLVALLWMGFRTLVCEVHGCIVVCLRMGVFCGRLGLFFDYLWNGFNWWVVCALDMVVKS